MLVRGLIFIFIAAILPCAAKAEPIRKHKPRSIHPANPTLDEQTFSVIGQLIEAEDRSLFIVLPIQTSHRRKLAAAQQIPTRSFPREIRRRVFVPPNGPSREKIKTHLGRFVEAVLVRDHSGHTFVLKLKEPSDT